MRLGNKDRGATDFTGAQTAQGLVRVVEREFLDRCLDRDLWSDRQEFVTIPTGQVGNGPDRPFAPKYAVGETRNVAHVNAGANDGAAFSNSSQRDGHKVTDGRIEDGGIQGPRRRLAGRARPHGAKRARKILRLGIASTGEGIDMTPLMPCQLRDNMGRGAEAVEAEMLGVTGKAKGAIADQAGTEGLDGLQSDRCRSGVA